MKNIIKHFAVVLLLLVVLMPFYGKILLQPNQYFFGHGDGMKNYYTPAYHIQHDSSYIYFEGMNYPHAEHIVYTDGQFLVSNALKFINHHIVSIADYSVGILNWLMLLSFALGGFLVYKILSELQVNRALAIVGSITIMFLSPQALRLPAHYALVYAFHIPLTWWLMLRPTILTKPIKWGSLLVLSTFGWFLVHPYLGVMLVLFQLSYWSISLLRDRQEWKRYLLLIILAVLPFLLFKLFMQSTDMHTGRIESPWGFLFFCGELDDIFVPNSGLLHSFLTKALAVPIFQRWEAMAYVGVFSTVAMAALILIKITSLFKKTTTPHSYLPNKKVQNSLLASIPLLLLAMGFPFKQFPVLLEYFPSVNQLRSVGRFGWVFFYVATVSSIYFYHQVWQQHKGLVLKIGVGIILLFSLLEPIPFHFKMATQISQFPNLLNKQLLPPIYKQALDYCSKKTYQALLPIPYYNVGSETFSYPNKADISTSMLLSYHAKLPLLSNYGSRMAAYQSRIGIQFLSPYHAPNPLLEKLAPQKPILVVYERKKHINPYEWRFLRKCKQLVDLGDWILYEVYPEQLKENKNAAYIHNFVNLRNSQKLYQQGSFYSSTISDFIYFNGFDGATDSITFESSGAYTIEKKTPLSQLVSFPPHTFERDKIYQLKLWVYNKDYLNTNFWHQLLGQTINKSGANATDLFQISAQNASCIYGNWSLLEHQFKVDSVEQTVVFSVQAVPQTPLPIRIDNLLVYEGAEQDLYWIPNAYTQDSLPKVIYKNNLKIILPNAKQLMFRKI